MTIMYLIKSHKFHYCCLFVCLWYTPFEEARIDLVALRSCEGAGKG